MATIRKAELAAQLELARAEISRLKAQLEAERAAHQQQIESVTSVASAVNKMQRPAYEQPEWQKQRAIQMAAAKDAAVRMGRTIKVDPIGSAA